MPTCEEGQAEYFLSFLHLRTGQECKTEKSFGGMKTCTYWHIFHSRRMCKELSVQVFSFPVIQAKKISSFICGRLHLKAGKAP